MSGDFWQQPVDSGSIPESDEQFDAIIVGAGPGGCSAAGHLAQQGKKVLLIDKAIFPRNKICGDAVGGKSLSIVKSLGVKERLEQTPHLRVTGIIFSSPNQARVRIPLPEEDVEKLEAGYVLPRIQFDWLLFERVQKLVKDAGGSIIQDGEVREIIHNEEEDNSVIGVEVRIGGREGEMRKFFAPWTVGSGGYQCPVMRNVLKEVHKEDIIDKKHYCGSYREYWTGIKECPAKTGDIEIHLVDGINPGYFWIFPTGAEGEANVGIGMVLSHLSKRKDKLKAMQSNIIANHPMFKERFAEAEIVEGGGAGWQLPFGSPRKNAKLQPRRNFSNGVLLVGDAASLVDPASGEGIGNALISGKIAAKHIVENRGGIEYQNELWGMLGGELTNSFALQKMYQRTWLLNMLLKRAMKRPKIVELMADSIASKDEQAKLHSKWYLFKTVFL